MFRCSQAWHSARNFLVFIFLHNYSGSYLPCNILQSTKEISSRTNHVFISWMALCSSLHGRMGFTLSSRTCPCPCPCPSLHSCLFQGHLHGIPRMAQPGLSTEIYFTFPRESHGKGKGWWVQVAPGQRPVGHKKKKNLLFLEGGGGDLHSPLGNKGVSQLVWHWLWLRDKCWPCPQALQERNLPW